MKTNKKHHHYHHRHQKVVVPAVAAEDAVDILCENIPKTAAATTTIAIAVARAVLH